MPIVSVIVPAFNRCSLVVEALESIRRQTWPAWEAIFVDDGSTDGTLKTLESLAREDSRIRVLSRSRTPKGASACRNIGLEAARGDYSILLDSDDLLGPACLENRVRALRENPDADFAVFPVLLFREALDDSLLLWNAGTAEPDLRRFLRGDSVWPINGPIWRTSTLRNLGGCDESLSCWQDVDLHARALLSGARYAKLLDREPDAFVRRHPVGSISQGGLRSREAVQSIVRVFQKACSLAGPQTTEEMRDTLRFSLIHVLQAALDNRHFDLAAESLATARPHRLVTPLQEAAWHFALRFHRARLDRLPGGRLLRNSLTGKYRRSSTIGIRKYARPDPAGPPQAQHDPEADPLEMPYLKRTLRRWKKSFRKRFGGRSAH